MFHARGGGTFRLWLAKATMFPSTEMHLDVALRRTLFLEETIG